MSAIEPWLSIFNKQGSMDGVGNGTSDTSCDFECILHGRDYLFFADAGFITPWTLQRRERISNP